MNDRSSFWCLVWPNQEVAVNVCDVVIVELVECAVIMNLISGIFQSGDEMRLHGVLSGP